MLDTDDIMLALLFVGGAVFLFGIAAPQNHGHHGALTFRGFATAVIGLAIIGASAAILDDSAAPTTTIECTATTPEELK